MSTIHEIIGKVGRVTGRVAPGESGEVVLPMQGGSEAFYAYGHDASDVIPANTLVEVTRFFPPRSVYVKIHTA